MIDAHNHYEIEFDVPSRHREEFEEWLSMGVVEWVSHETITYFEVFENDTGLSPEVKFVFGFETLRDWATFVGSDEHVSAVDSLNEFTESREAVLWQHTSVELDLERDTQVCDGGIYRGANGTKASDMVLSQ